METYQEHRRIRAFFASRAVLIGLFLLLMGTGIVSFQALLAGNEVKQEQQEIEQELRELQAQKEQLTSELEDLRGGQGIEREAREKLNFRKPGEEVVIIVENADANLNKEERQETGVLKRFWEWLGL